MHPETKKLTQKNMPYLTLTLTENLKLQLSPGVVWFRVPFDKL